MGLEGWVSLLSCAPPPLPKEAGLVGRDWCCNGSPALCTPLNNGTPLPWWSGPHPPKFLAMEPSLPTAHSSPLPGSTFQTPLAGTQPSSPPKDTQPRLGCPGLPQGPCAQAPLHPALPQNKLMVTHGERRGAIKGRGIKRYKLLCIK